MKTTPLQSDSGTARRVDAIPLGSTPTSGDGAPWSIAPSSRAADAKAYKRAAEARSIDLRLDANEGPLSLLGRLMVDASPPGTLAEPARVYPDASGLELRLCERLGVDGSRLVVTAGGDDALCRICQAVLEPGREAVATTPTFEMIPRYVGLAGATLREAPWMDGPFPLERFASLVDDRTSAMFVVTPNNPTGSVAIADDLRELSRRAPRALLVVDLAYTEFADTDLTPVALSLPNAVVVRTFSKAWGLAGLRVGYAAGPARVIDWLRAVGQPYAASGPSIALAVAALDGFERDMNVGVAKIRRERAELTALLSRSQTRVLPSEGNFVLARFDDSLAFADALADRGIAVRRFVSRPELDGWVRITCPGDESAMRRLVDAIESWNSRRSTGIPPKEVRA